MKVAIVGSREKFLAKPASVRIRVRDYIAALPRDTIIISGGARGVDSYAGRAARDCGLILVEYPADWLAAPRGAGMIRNKVVVEQADRVVIFWDGASPGSANVIRLCKAAAKPIEIYAVERRVLA